MSKNTVFFIGVQGTARIPSSHWNPKIFFTKPVFVDKQGFEYWEIASWKREVIEEFITGLRKEKGLTLKIEKFKNEKLDDVHFPHVMPKLSPKQKRAFELAVEHDYYKFPRRANLEELAKLMGCAISTYQEHLRIAEAKLIPSLKTSK